MHTFRKIFIIVAGGNVAAEKHFQDTIKRKRTIDEVRHFLPRNEIKNLEDIYQKTPFIVWGSVPGRMNEPRWEKMETGDIVLIYNHGFIRYVGEIAAKVRSKDLARHFWKETGSGNTWELMYFIVNEEKINVPMAKINRLFGYNENYAPRGFTMIGQEQTGNFTKYYGDIYGVLQTLEKGGELTKIPHNIQTEIKEIQEEIARSPTEHDEIQWRLIHLGRLAKLNVWIPRNDQGKQYQGRQFRDFVLSDFHETIDVPPTIKNIDVVWKFGPYSVKSAFEIEHSTSIYSGILRLSDLHVETPNSTYPLFIVAPEERKRKVFDELHRPTFSEPHLRLNEVVKFIGYKTIREIDNATNEQISVFDANNLFSRAESITQK